MQNMQKDANTQFTNLKVDGGASNNNLLLQIQCNLIEAKVIRPVITETTALGVGFLAGLGSGYWKSIDDVKNIWKHDREFLPEIFNKENILSNWREAINVLC